MMGVKVFSFLLLCSCILCACNAPSATEQTGGDAKAPASSGVVFNRIDSLEFIYYPNANNQRQYLHTMVRETALLEQVKETLAAPPAEGDTCSHEVKLYLFNNGEVYKTIYVALADSCRYLAYAVNSKRQFVKMEASLQQRFKRMAAALQ